MLIVYAIAHVCGGYPIIMRGVKLLTHQASLVSENSSISVC